MKQQSLAKSLRLLFSAAMIAVLVMGMAPIQTARAEVMPSTSDLVVTLVSIPKNVKACDIFEAVFAVTNLGPDPATGLQYSTGMSDPYQDITIWRAPASLGIGQTGTFKVVIWVGGFVEGETRAAYVTASAMSNPYPNTSIDPNMDNNILRTTNKIIGKHTQCS